MRLRVLQAPSGASQAPGLRPVFGHLTECEVTGRYRWVRHRHDQYETLLPVAGIYRCRINDHEISIRPGQAVVVKPGDWHEDPLSPGVRYLGLNFGLRGAQPDTQVALFAEGIEPRSQIAQPLDQVHATIERLRSVVDDRSLPAAGLRTALVTELFWLLVRALPAEALARPFRQHDADAAFIDSLRRLFDTHASRPLAVPAMARALGVTTNVLTHRCRAALGLAPARALLNHRLDHARLLLETSDLPVQEVAQRLGFADPFHFSRAFKRHHGSPPSAVR